MRAPLLLLAALGAGCGGGGDEPAQPPIAIAAEARPPGDVPEYGSVLPVRFLLRNESGFPVLVDRVEILEGYRRTLAVLAVPHPGEPRGVWTHAGLLLPGQSLTLEAPYRIVSPKERLLLTVRTCAEGDLEERVRFLEAGAELPATPERIDAFRRSEHPPLRPPVSRSPRAVRLLLPRSPAKLPEILVPVRIPCPEPPFDPRARGAAGWVWTWSGALRGYVFRHAHDDVRLYRADETVALPPVPFAFLQDLDATPEGVEVLLRGGRRRRVAAPDLDGFLRELRGARLGVEALPGRGEEGARAYAVR